MQYHYVGINPLLTSSPTGTAYFRPVALDWDLRRAPHHAACITGRVISDLHLNQLATHPGVATLHIVSDLLAEDWVITAHNPAGVTIDDVLTAVYTALRAPLAQSEWECVPPMQRSRIETVFYARCQASRNFDRTRYGGIRRVDCLLHTTVFAGLSSLMYRNGRWEIVLTLSRDFGAHGRTGSHPEAQQG